MIKSFVGPMFSGKSDSLISVYNKIWNKDIVMAFKPYNDTRDGKMIKSKNYEITIPAIYINNLNEIKDYVISKNIHTVFIDEAQLLEGDVKELLDLSVVFDIDFFIAGLNMTSEQKPFGIMGDILSISDEIVNITGFCQDCNKPSIYTFYEGVDKEGDVLVGDNNYISLCAKCLKRRLLKKDNYSLILNRGIE